MCDVCKLIPKKILQLYKEKEYIKITIINNKFNKHILKYSLYHIFSKVRERGALNILKKFLKDYEDLKKNDNTIPSETINATKVVSDELVENTKTNCTGQSSSEEINLHVVRPKNKKVNSYTVKIHINCAHFVSVTN